MGDWNAEGRFLTIIPLITLGMNMPNYSYTSVLYLQDCSRIHSAACSARGCLKVVLYIYILDGAILLNVARRASAYR